MPGNGEYTLYGAKGGGSMIVEAAFAKAHVPVRCIDVPWDDMGWESRTLGALNPLGQVPTLVMPDGSIMTESAAMILHLADVAPASELVPPADDPGRAAFLRWLVFLVAAVYPTFTFGDVPKRWTEGDEAAAKKLRASTDAHRERLWRYVESQIDGPWFLRGAWSALDLYLWPMTFWRPGRAWFESNCPKLGRIGVAMDADRECLAVAERNGL
jgi:GST-like protein